MTDIFALDTEVTTFHKGDPFDSENSFVLGGLGTDQWYSTFDLTTIASCQSKLSSAKMVVLFNAKFDLHWLRRIGISFSIRLPIWDCQLAEFILSNQQWKYPSLDESCANRGLPRKLDIVKTEYWDNGINTNEIPHEILNEYLRGDINSTYQLYLAQVEEFKKPEHQSKYKLFRLQCYDLLVLEEMEYNGYKFDVEQAQQKAADINRECNRIESLVYSHYPDVPLNLNSGNHVSCMLYGGTIVDTIKVPVGVYKTGAKAGQVKYSNLDQQYTLPRIIEPIKGSDLKGKEGEYYQTGEDVLVSLPAKGNVKKVINLILERRGLEKLRGTYYDGIPALIEEHHWKDNLVHGNLNQCVTSTSRLSAAKPNQQNMPPDCKRLCVSRY